MKKINVRSILDPLSNKEMKNVTGGNDPNSLMMGGDGEGQLPGHCCDALMDNCHYQVRCSKDESCVPGYGPGAKCVMD